MNLNYIRAFYYVAKLGSISQAARYLNLDQPTVTKKVRLLEEEIKQSLIIRGARGAKLTEKGEIFYAHAKKVIQELSYLEDHFFGTQPDSIRIVASQGIGSYLLPKTLSELKIKDTQVPLNIHMSSDLDFESLLEADLYIGPFIEGLEKTHQVQHIHDFMFHFYASDGYLRKNGSPKRVADLKKHAMISFNDERRSAFEETKLSYLVTDPEFQTPQISTKSAFAEMDMTSRGIGVALLSDIGVKHFKSKVHKLNLTDFDGVKTPAYAFVKKETGRDKASFLQKLCSSFQNDLSLLA